MFVVKVDCVGSILLRSLENNILTKSVCLREYIASMSYDRNHVFRLIETITGGMASGYHGFSTHNRGHDVFPVR